MERLLGRNDLLALLVSIIAPDNSRYEEQSPVLRDEFGTVLSMLAVAFALFGFLMH
jgi:hypothetical protein